MVSKKNPYRRDERPFMDIEDEFARRDVVNDDFTGNRGMDDASFRYLDSPSRERDFLQSKHTNPDPPEEQP